MLVPVYEQVSALSGEYGRIPVCREVYSDFITPISLIRKFAEKSQRCFLLESVEGGKQWGRYSFLGVSPTMKVCCRDGRVLVEHNGQASEQRTSRPLDVLREILRENRSPVFSGMPPFTGGFVGYFSYSMIQYAEPKLSISRGELNDFDVMLFDKVIAFDHLRQKICVIVNMRAKDGERGYREASDKIDKLTAVIRADAPVQKKTCGAPPEFSCDRSKQEYCAAVERTKEYIRAGDIFQAVISRKFSARFPGSLISAYRVLRATNPSPYLVYLKIDDTELMCSSPETLVRLKDGKLTTLPVAGSRPRGKTREEDLQLERELLSDEKELSEHNMLVDLGRNDLGKISKFGSVRVTESRAVHRFSKIMHICSQVESEILPQCDGCSAVEAVLPAGTLSGAPKIRACEIIEELEHGPRGVYGGAIGYLDFTGNADTCIAIRMAVKKGDTVSVQAGAGIVADSVPEREYEESGNKALAVIEAIRRAGEVEEI